MRSNMLRYMTLYTHIDNFLACNICWSVDLTRLDLGFRFYSFLGLPY